MKPWIVITGSSGLIGRALIKRLSKTYEIAAIDIAPMTLDDLPDTVRFFEVDLGDPKAILNFFAKNPRPITGLINLAAYYTFSNASSIHYERLKNGLTELAASYRQLKTNTSCFIQASSMACLNPVYPGTQIDSQAESYPRWEYPKFKMESERILRTELANEHYVEFVIAGVYTDFCELVPLFHFLDSHLQFRIQRWFYPGNGQQGLTYVHLEDLCDAFQRQLSVTPRKRRLLIGEQEPTTYKQIATIVDKEFIGFVLPKCRVPKWLARLGAWVLCKMKRRSFYQPWMIAFADEHYQFDIRATIEQLGWEPKRRLRIELPAMVRRSIERPTEWVKLNTQRPWHEDDWTQLNARITQDWTHGSEN